MIVDDEADVSYFVEIILKLNGYKVVTAGSAEDAMEKIKSGPEKIDLVFSDVGLPRLDGFGLCAAARKAKPGIKVVLTSGYIDGSLKTRMAEAGVDGFLAKPYDMSDLLTSIRAVLDKH
jgi:two-component system cell cycle sensor histidine kinase/response regulator CckA